MLRDNRLTGWLPAEWGALAALAQLCAPELARACLREKRKSWSACMHRHACASCSWHACVLAFSGSGLQGVCSAFRVEGVPVRCDKQPHAISHKHTRKLLLLKSTFCACSGAGLMCTAASLIACLH